MPSGVRPVLSRLGRQLRENQEGKPGGKTRDRRNVSAQRRVHLRERSVCHQDPHQDPSPGSCHQDPHQLQTAPGNWVIGGGPALVAVPLSSSMAARNGAIPWGRMSSCVAVANRHARRLAIGAQLGKLPHSRTCPALKPSALNRACFPAWNATLARCGAETALAPTSTGALGSARDFTQSMKFARAFPEGCTTARCG